MTEQVRFGPEAVTELDHAIRWYEQRHTGLGLAFLTAVERTVQTISQWPSAGTPIPDIANNLNIRRTGIPGFPYHLAYLQNNDTIHILAIVHNRRRPWYWQTRIQDQ